MFLKPCGCARLKKSGNMQTVLEIIKATTSYFEKRGIENPRLNVEHLLSHVLGVRRMELYMQFDRPLGETELGPLRELVKRRGAGEPLQHLLGSVEFFGREFICDGRGLVPRPETEQLVEKVVERLKAQFSETGKGQRVVDVGTGSGVIAITLALECPWLEVWAVDREEAALELAGINAKQLGVSDRVKIVQGDLLEGLSGPFDWIVANLPYIPTGQIGTLAAEVQHDPHSALDGGVEGLDLIQRLIEQAPGVLQKNGGIALEIGHNQADAVCHLLQNNFSSVCVEQDYHGIERFVLGSYG